MTAPIERTLSLRRLSAGSPPYKGIVDLSRRVAAEQGLRFFWQGNHQSHPLFSHPGLQLCLQGLHQVAVPALRPHRPVRSVLPRPNGFRWVGWGRLPLLGLPVGLRSNPPGCRRWQGQEGWLAASGRLPDQTASGPRGFLGLYNGFGVSVAGTVFYRGVYFGLYDSLREKNPWKNDLGTLGVASKFGLAQTTTLAAAYASHPFDTVRRRMWVGIYKAKEASLYKGGLVDCFCKIVREEGLRALYRDAHANVYWVVGSALVLVFYDQLQGMLGLNLGAGSE